jgi:hypothetical protein
MTGTLRSKTRPRPSPASRRFGYVIAIVINIVLIVIANNLLDWGWFTFLTNDFSDVLWLLNVSLAVGIAANLWYVVNDSRRPKAFGQTVTNVMSMLVSIRMLQVFPFDFSGWDTNWSWLIRTLIILAIAGSAIGAIVELVKLIGAARDIEEPAAG